MTTTRSTGPSTRQRILDTGAELFRRQGYVGTGMKEIVAGAAAPFGSIYHFFPSGKVQLGEEVIRSSGDIYQELADAFFDAAPDVAIAVDDFFAAAAVTLRDTDYADACPIATIALEVASTNDTLRRATADVFAGWVDAVGDRFVTAGISEPRARELAIATIALLEGAFVLARAARSTEPVEVAGATAAATVRQALGGRAEGRARPSNTERVATQRNDVRARRPDLLADPPR